MEERVNTRMSTEQPSACVGNLSSWFSAASQDGTFPPRHRTLTLNLKSVWYFNEHSTGFGVIISFSSFFPFSYIPFFSSCLTPPPPFFYSYTFSYVPYLGAFVFLFSPHSLLYLHFPLHSICSSFPYSFPFSFSFLDFIPYLRLPFFLSSFLSILYLPHIFALFCFLLTFFLLHFFFFVCFFIWLFLYFYLYLILLFLSVCRNVFLSFS